MFTPIQSFLGGYLLHLATSTILTDTGRVFGISSLLDGAVWGEGESWRWASLVGLVAGPVIVRFLDLASTMSSPGGTYSAQGLFSAGLGRYALAGLFVGSGTKLGSGCTSGHFLCGLSRLSPRSVLATMTFFPIAVITSRYFPLDHVARSTGDGIPARAEIGGLDTSGRGVAHVENGTGGLGGLDSSHRSETMERVSIPSIKEVAGMLVLIAAIALANRVLRTVLLAEPPTTAKRQTTSKAAVADPSIARQAKTASLVKSFPFNFTRTDAPYLLAGLSFSLGLLLSGMSDPDKVLGFFRFPWPFGGGGVAGGVWDPSLAMVFLGGVVPNGLHWRSLTLSASGTKAVKEEAPSASLNGKTSDGPEERQPRPLPLKPTYPWEATAFPGRVSFASPPSKWNITPQLVLGSALFGIGWGLSGICPGPMLVGLGQTMLDALSTAWKADAIAAVEMIKSRVGLLGFAMAVSAGQRTGRLLA